MLAAIKYLLVWETLLCFAHPINRIAERASKFPTVKTAAYKIRKIVQSKNSVVQLDKLKKIHL